MSLNTGHKETIKQIKNHIAAQVKDLNADDKRAYLSSITDKLATAATNPDALEEKFETEKAQYETLSRSISSNKIVLNALKDIEGDQMSAEDKKEYLTLIASAAADLGKA